MYGLWLCGSAPRYRGRADCCVCTVTTHMARHRQSSVRRESGCSCRTPDRNQNSPTSPPTPPFSAAFSPKENTHKSAAYTRSAPRHSPPNPAQISQSTAVLLASVRKVCRRRPHHHTARVIGEAATHVAARALRSLVPRTHTHCAAVKGSPKRVRVSRASLRSFSDFFMR